MRTTMSPFAIGWKALAANLSDIAAMGGIPDYYLVSAAFTKSWLDDGAEIYRGMAALADRYHMDLIGGDTVSTHDALVLTVTVFGHISDDGVFLRSDARPGDAVLVTGTLGDSAAGLAVLNGEIRLPEGDRSFLIRRHQLPEPRLDAARLLADLPGRAALDDISDGLASEANEIAKASGVSIVLDYDKLPKSGALSQLKAEQQRQCLLFGGEDYELLMTIPQKQAARYIAAFSDQRLSLTRIGEVVTAPYAPAVFFKIGRR
ncbi:thiamine-phosphate kinase [Terrilactibacillus sp. S3-3]|nr:thiamine-phosphate kinase [Terrilactibacillus sp. S3-3]